MTSYYGAFNANTNRNTTYNYGFLLGYKASENLFLRIGAKRIILSNSIDDNKIDIEYLEIPLEVKYSFSNKKLNPFITGGTSYLKLQNEPSVNFQQIEYLDTSISLNLGAGLEYKLFESLFVNGQANFNYPIKSFSNNADFKPFILSVGLGLDYRF